MCPLCLVTFHHVIILANWAFKIFLEGESMKLLENRILNDGNVLGETS